MKIALDTNGYYTGKGGVARYTRKLQESLQTLATGDVQVEALSWPVFNTTFTQPWRAMKTAYRELFWARLVAPAILSRGRYDLAHLVSSVPIQFPPTVRKVVTLHDVAPLRHPERFRRWHRHAWHHYAASLASADRIICVSQFTADEAMALLGLPASLLEVVHHGVDPPPPAELGAAPNIPDEFLLFVGCLEPGKNLDLLRETYARANAEGDPLPPLVIVGPRRHGVTIGDIGLDEWRVLGVQPDTVLYALYQRAAALLFPSRYEGFGLPVLEAMSVGCPVICSPIASLPEVAGDAALFSEQDPAAYLDAIRSLLSQESLHSELSEKGRERAARFTWKSCAENTVNVYRDVLQS